MKKRGDDVGSPATRRDETLGLDDPAAPDHEQRPPVEDWNRYRFEDYLGGGGMGRVFKAHDPVLDRKVALKFIRGDDPVTLRRFKQEARAQAGVDHDRICKVYEVGEVEGRPYIAMQYIEGMPFDLAARDMSLEQKLVAGREAAEALHAAHRKGLIHRDVKPGNILIERTESGEYRPYVMDFGLARDPGSAGATRTGVVVGTPHYMPPEQAAGKTLDRRADVYGLGATLYEVLVGRRPFTGESPTVVLMQVLQDVPESLARFDRAMPADVEAIVMKCLRKDPRERYASARELADDLGRYLDGEPVKARPTGLLYRLRVKAARNRTAVGVTAVALTLLVAALAWGGFARWNAARRARLAQSFGQQVERIEALARYAHTIPLHDIRPERQRMRALMEQIERRMDAVGRIGKGPGHYALGRGHLALGNLVAAREHLETAWETGYRPPGVAYALGRTLGEQYSRALHEAQQIASSAERTTRKREIERTLRNPALAYLAQAGELETESSAFVEALIAHYEDRHDDALGKAREAYEHAGWMYEARRLEGDVYLARADEKGNVGEFEDAMRDYARAGSAYDTAARIGESDPAVHVSRCRLGRSMMRMELRARAGDVSPFFERGVRACEAALTADPDSVEALVLEAKLRARMGEYNNARGEDPRPYLEAAIATLGRAFELRADDPAALRTLGYAESELARHAIQRGEDPRPSLERAVAAYERALDSETSDRVGLLNDTGVAYKDRAGYLADHGEDPRPDLARAAEAYRAALVIDPERLSAQTNLAVVLFRMANWAARHGDDPGEYLEATIAACERALEISPDQMVVQYQLGRAYGEQASYRERHGDDPTSSLERSAAAYRRALEINPQSAYRAHFLNGLGQALYRLASYRARTGERADPDYEAAIAALEQSIEANPDLVFAHGNLASLLNERARHRAARGEDPSEDVERAIASCLRALDVKPDDLWAHVDLGVAYRVRAAHESSRGQDPSASLRAGHLALEAALEIDPEASEPHLALGGLWLLEAELAGSTGERQDKLVLARTSFERAISIDPHLPPDDAEAWDRLQRLLRAARLD